jgi:hypothetical protein
LDSARFSLRSATLACSLLSDASDESESLSESPSEDELSAFAVFFVADLSDFERLLLLLWDRFKAKSSSRAVSFLSNFVAVTCTMTVLDFEED